MFKAYVGNLSYQAQEQEFKTHVESHVGPIQAVKLVMDRDTGRPRGFGFVTFDSDEQRTEAIQRLNGSSYMGRTLNVKEAVERPREDRGPRRESRPSYTDEMASYGSGNDFRDDRRDRRERRERNRSFDRGF